MKSWERLVRAGLSRVQIVKVRTAINPLLWPSGVTLPMCLGAIFAIEDHSIRAGLLALSAVPIGAWVLAYFILLFRDPDRLQSEEYRIRQQALQILYRRGRGADIVDIAISGRASRARDRDQLPTRIDSSEDVSSCIGRRVRNSHRHPGPARRA